LQQQPLRIGFDAMSVLYKYKASYKDLYPILELLQKQGHRILFVFDGKAPDEKQEEVAQRREVRTDAATHAEKIREYLAKEDSANIPENERKILEDSVQRLDATSWHLTRAIRHEVQKELFDRKIPYIRGIQEADGVLIDLCGAGKLDVVVSTDMDYLLSGVVKRLWIPVQNDEAVFEELDMKTVLNGEGMTQEAFRDAGILCGVEPLRGRLCIHAKKAFNWLRYYKSIDCLLQGNVADSQIYCLREKELLASVRAHFAPRTDWTSQIRPDHLETVGEFLRAL
jgi:5'-3' exonuclease